MAVDERQAQRENLRMRSIPIEKIMEHLKMVNEANAAREQAEQQQLMQQPPDVGMQSVSPPPNQMPPMSQPLPPEPQATAPATPPPAGPGGLDIQTGDPLQLPQNIVPVNTWDNHETHVEVHNRFRKSQAFELLPDLVKQQFEYHVQMHAEALNQSAAAAQMMPPPQGGPGTPPPGTENPQDQGLPVGSNQFGPPDTGAPATPSNAPQGG